MESGKVNIKQNFIRNNGISKERHTTVKHWGNTTRSIDHRNCFINKFVYKNLNKEINTKTIIIITKIKTNNNAAHLEHCRFHQNPKKNVIKIYK